LLYRQLHDISPRKTTRPPEIRLGNSLPPDCFVSRGSILLISLFLERDYPGKIIMW